MAIKILIGGSPCTYWSIAQTNNRETKAEGMGWELFKNYLIAKEKFKPDFFLYENNKSASQAIKDQIAEEFGVGVDPDVRFTYCWLGNYVRKNGNPCKYKNTSIFVHTRGGAL